MNIRVSRPTVASMATNQQISERLEHLEQRIEKLGAANNEAFSQVKKVMERLAEVIEEVRANQDEYSGVITASTYNSN